MYFTCFFDAMETIQAAGGATPGRVSGSLTKFKRLNSYGKYQLRL